MDRLKELRQALNYSQKQLADILKTTQQTIGRWERGDAEPSLEKLRDIALIFGVSVDELIGHNSIFPTPQTTAYHLVANKSLDGFWGHIGLLMDGAQHSSWFPISASISGKIAGALESGDEWITFPTLANKIVALRPDSVRKIYLLDDACDEPEGDWELEFPYQGLPLEIYKGLARLYNTQFDKADWEEAAKFLPSENDDGTINRGSPLKWEEFAKEVSLESFEGNASSNFIASISREFIDQKLYEEERFYKILHHTNIQMIGGEIHSIWCESESLRNTIDAIEAGNTPKIFHFEEFGGASEIYIPSSRVSAVSMPLIDILE